MGLMEILDRRGFQNGSYKPPRHLAKKPLCLVKGSKVSLDLLGLVLELWVKRLQVVGQLAKHIEA